MVRFIGRNRHREVAFAAVAVQGKIRELRLDYFALLAQIPVSRMAP
ncbi:MAG: hypothetical protein ACLPPF_09770 [Rhodomicrobium sp.]